MRVGIDVRALQFEGGRRGTGRYVNNLLQGLLDLDKDTHYSLLYYAELPFPEQLNVLSDRADKAPVYGAPTLHTRYSWYQSTPSLRSMRVLPGIHWRSYYRAQSKAISATVLQENLDVVHFTAAFDLNISPANDCPVKTVYTFLDAIPLVYPDLLYNKWPIPFRRLYDRMNRAFQSASQVVAISDCSRNDAIRLYGIDPARAHRVYAALHRELYDPIGLQSVESARKKHGLNRRYFAFCSVMDAHKGFDSMIAAMGRLPELSSERFQLAIIGPQREETVRTMRSMCFEKFLHAGDVIVTGFVDDRELMALIKGSVALLSPSRYEGFGYSAAQALAIGTPVISSNRSSLPEVVGDAALLVDPDNIEDIVTAMKRLATDKTLCKELVRRGHAQAERFKAGPLAEELWKIYALAAS